MFDEDYAIPGAFPALGDGGGATNMFNGPSMFGGAPSSGSGGSFSDKFDSMFNSPQFAGAMMMSNLRDPNSMGRAFEAMQQMNQQKQMMGLRREEMQNQINAHEDNRIQHAETNKYNTSILGLREREVALKEQSAAAATARENIWQTQQLPQIIAGVNKWMGGEDPTGVTAQIVQPPQAPVPAGAPQAGAAPQGQMGSQTEEPNDGTSPVSMSLPQGQALPPLGQPQPGPAPVAVERNQPAPQPSASGDPTAPPQQPKSNFLKADAFVARKDIEGGYNANDAGKGAVNQGVLQSTLDRFHPGLNVKDASPEILQGVRKHYWDAIGGDNLDPKTAMVGYDAAINQGEDYARKLIERTGGNPQLMLAERRQKYADLAKQDQYKPFLNTWNTRLDKLEASLKDGTGPTAIAATPEDAKQAQPVTGQRISPDKRMQINAALLMLGDPKQRTQGMLELSKAMKPEYATPGSVNMQTGEVVPDARLIEDKAQHLIANKRNERLDARQAALDVLNQDSEEGKAAREERRVKVDEQRAASDKAVKDQEAAKGAQAVVEQKAKDYGMTSHLLQQSNSVSQAVTNLINNPALDHITGRYSGLPDSARKLVDPQGMNAKNDLKSVSSSILIDTVEQLKMLAKNGSTGFGALSDTEGSHLKNAIASLEDSSTTETLQKNLKTVRSVFNQAMDRTTEVYEKTHNASPYDGLPVGTRPVREDGAQKMSKNGLPLLRLPDGKLVEVRQ